MKKIIAVALALLIALTLISFAGCHTHDLVNVKAVEPSCTEEGNIEYYECSICGETFLDAEGRPGGDGELRYYEDDGISQRYTTEFATTRITKRQEGAVIRAEIAAREGSYAGAPATRSYELRFPATFPPQRVTVNGVEIPYSRFPKAGEWTYDAYTLAPVIYTEAVACDRPLTVELTLDAAALPKQETLYGKSGIFKRCLDLTVEFKLEQGGHGEPYLLLPKEYLRISQCPNFILERPELTVELISQFDETLAKMFETTDKMELLGPAFKEKLHRQLGGEK